MGLWLDAWLFSFSFLGGFFFFCHKMWDHDLLWGQLFISLTKELCTKKDNTVKTLSSLTGDHAEVWQGVLLKKINTKNIFLWKLITDLMANIGMIIGQTILSTDPSLITAWHLLEESLVYSCLIPKGLFFFLSECLFLGPCLWSILSPLGLHISTLWPILPQWQHSMASS